MRTLISEADLQHGVGQLAQQISDDFSGKPLAIVGLLQDSIVLLADLMKLMYVPSQMCIVQTRAGHAGPEKPALVIDHQVARIVQNRHVLVVDDILDSGHSLLDVICQLDELGTRSIRSAVLLRKKGKQEIDHDPDYIIFDVDDEVIVGYGLDYQGSYRHLPYIAALDPSDLDTVDKEYQILEQEQSINAPR